MSTASGAMTLGLATVGIGVAGAAVKGHPPTARQLIGAGAFVIILTAVATASPSIGTGLAALALTSTVLIAGPPVFAAITHATTGKSAP